MRARGFRPWSFTACSLGDEQRGRPVADLARHRGGEATALDERGQRADLLPVGLTRSFVERALTERDDLVLEAALGARPQRTLVRLDRERLHVVTRDVPLLGDQLGAAELRHLLVAVARLPPGRLGERRLVAELLARDHRRHDRDLAHVLHAAGDDEVLRARHHALRGEVDGLLRGAALTVDGGAGHRLRGGRRRANRCGRCHRPAGPMLSTLPNTTSSTAAGSTPVRSISALIEWAPRSAGWTCDSPPLAPADRACGPLRRCRPRPWGAPASRCATSC